MNLIASLMIGFGRIFWSKKTIKKESITGTPENVHEETQAYRISFCSSWCRLMSLGFATQIWGLAVE